MPGGYMLSILIFLICVTVAYFLGSACSAVIVSKIFELPDPRQEGSKNPGATNVLRLSGKKYASIVLLGDMLKGFLPVILAKILGAGPTIIGFTCLAAVIGHVFPVFFNYRGGKGVATAMGGLIGLNFPLGIIVIAIWLLVAKLSHYVSLASIVSMVLAPILSIIAIGNAHALMPLILVALLILYKHSENINRLMDGVEPKINLKSANIAQIIIEETNDSETPKDKPKPKADAVKPKAAAAKAKVATAKAKVATAKAKVAAAKPKATATKPKAKTSTKKKE